jgi:monoterpene epsilon-lactone hydrolase
VGGLWAIPEHEAGGRAVMYLYGGGYVISTPQSRRKTAGHLAQASGARVLVPHYRLAPEHPFPAAVDDATHAYEWMLGEGFAPEGTVVAGDSSGGGLAMATLVQLHRNARPLPAGGVALSPWVDLACTGDTLTTNADVDITVTKASLERMAGQYLHGADPKTPLASPLYADLSGLPPLLLVVGGDEALLDDSIRLGRAAGIAGVDTTLFIGAGMQHIFPVYCGAFPEADAAIAMIGDWIHARLH